MASIFLYAGVPSRLANIARYSLYPCVFRESVAEHSYYVTLYCILIADLCDDTSIDVEMLVSMAVCHDWGEAFGGDVDGVFKRQNPAVKAVIDRTEEKCVTAWLNAYDPKIAGRWFAAMRANDSGAIECLILKIADFLSVLQFCQREMLAGNKAFLLEIADVLPVIDKLIEDVNERALNQGSHSALLAVLAEARTLALEIDRCA